jgi:hypothetical protein
MTRIPADTSSSSAAASVTGVVLRELQLLALRELQLLALRELQLLALRELQLLACRWSNT